MFSILGGCELLKLLPTMINTNIMNHLKEIIEGANSKRESKSSINSAGYLLKFDLAQSLACLKIRKVSH